MIQAIVYDAVGTLMHVNPSVEAVYADVGRRFGSRLEAAEIRARFRGAFALQDRLDEAAGWRTSEERERERWRTIVGQVLDDVADADGCFDVLYAAFTKAEAWAFDLEWEAVSAHFQERGLRQALASNFDGRLHGILASMPAAERIEHVVVSSEVGWRKPAREFFAHLLATLRLPAEEILFVGDDLVNDYEAARAMGMRAMLLDPAGIYRDSGAATVDRLGILTGV